MPKMTEAQWREARKKIGLSVKRVRKELKETQVVFGERFGISGASLSYIERGKKGGITLEHLVNIAQGLEQQSLDTVAGWSLLLDFFRSSALFETHPAEDVVEQTADSSDEGGPQNEHQPEPEESMPSSPGSDADNSDPANDDGVCVSQTE